MASSEKEQLYNTLISNCDSILQRADRFIGPQKQTADDFRNFTKTLYDFMKKDEIIKIPSSVALQNLIIHDFDDEQIWQELELQNSAYKTECVNLISKVIASSKRNSTQLTFASSGKKKDDDVNILDDDEIKSQTDSEDESDNEELKLKSLERAHFEDADDDSMSDISVELEKALDKRILLDQENGNSGDDDDDVKDDYEEDKGGSEDKEDDSDEAINESAKNKYDFEVEKQNKSKRSIVDDTFFKLSELEQFLKSEDAKEEKRLQQGGGDDDSNVSDDEINYFEDIQSDGNESEGDSDNSGTAHKRTRKLKYDDFFDPPETDYRDDSNNRKLLYENIHKVADEEEDLELASVDGDGDDTGDGELKEKTLKSSFEKRQEKLQEKIRLLEESNLSEKPWQLMGESAAYARPQNSLLQEHFEFDHMTRQAPVITEEVTVKLEDIIKRRIKDKMFDDVERKIKPKEDPFEYKKKIILDHDKSKLSLAELYEQEYLKQQQNDKSKEEEEPPEHKAIRESMSILFVKLDALSNFHFVPKPVTPEVKIVNNLPAIVVENVAPVTMSDATLLAPEEIKGKRKGELMGKSERTTTDKKRERRSKKSLQRRRKHFREAQTKITLAAGLGHKYNKMAVKKQLAEESNVTLLEEGNKKEKRSKLTSKHFFNKLQEEVQMSIEMKKADNKKSAKNKLSIDKLKL